jgi:ERCC4-type nuclease
LAIGKHGQNVRLASRLIGWELDIRTKTTAAAAVLVAKEKEVLEEKPAPEEKEVPSEKEAKKKKKEESSLEKLPGVGKKTLASLKEAGLNSIGDILKAKLEDLTKIKGIGEKKAEKIIEEAKKLNRK